MIFKKQALKILAALGKKEGDVEILSLIEMIGGGFELEETTTDKHRYVYYKFCNKAVEFYFENNYLKAVFFYLIDNHNFDLFEKFDLFLFKISQTSSLAGVKNLLENKYQVLSENKNWVKFNIGSNSLHFEFDSDRMLSKCTFISGQ